MDYRVKLAIPPAAEPVSLEEAKSAARELTDDFDSEIAKLIKAAREEAEKYQNRFYMTQTWEQSYDSFPATPIEIKKPPLQSLESVTLFDQNGGQVLVSPGDFIVSTRSNRIWFKPEKLWPSISLQQFDSVVFRYKSGFTDISSIPESVQLAIKLYVSYFLDNPEAEKPPEAFYSLLSSERWS